MTASARQNMVNGQIRPNQVNDSRVLAAMRALPRERFTPPGAQAYADADIALGGGRFMLAPLVTARLAQLVMEGNPAHVLVIGAGTGYGAAILQACGAQVVALEEESGPPACTPEDSAVESVRGKLALGWPAGGPYDAILIEGAVMEIPRILSAQLVPGGRVVTIISTARGPGMITASSPGIITASSPGISTASGTGISTASGTGISTASGTGISTASGRGGLGHCVVAETSINGFAVVRRFDCAAHVLPAFQPAPAFSF